MRVESNPPTHPELYQTMAKIPVVQLDVNDRRTTLMLLRVYEHWLC